MSAGEALLAALPPITFVVGKGGVGKSTCAAALALHASRNAPTLLVSTDPARALPSVLDSDVGTAPTTIPYAAGLSAQMLDASVLRGRFMERWGDTVRTILDRGTYLDDADIGPLVDTALPGGDEIFAALELARLFGEVHEGRLFIDTAPTGHTLRLLALPGTFRALVQLLDAMQDKHRFMVRALTQAYRADAADDFIATMRAQVEALEATLSNPTRCAAVLVTNTQPVVVAESRRYLGALAELRIAVAGVVWNGETHAGAIDTRPQYAVPRLTESPSGEQGLRAWFAALTVPDRLAPTPVIAPSNKPSTDPSLKMRAPSWLPPFTIVAGKGGVGKTTVACALAIAAASDHQTLIVSTDPAPSLADAFGQEIPDADTAVAGVSRLFARQMDATAAFERLRSEYATRVDALFDSLMDRGVSLAGDRAIARDLLALAPPGVDEMYALTLLQDALTSDRFARVIVDPAPTGHLLRLLEMPRLALSWTHQLMRMMLKYKDVAGLGDTARELLDFAKGLRSVEALLGDRDRSGVVLVTLDEPVVRAESGRLAGALTDIGLSVRAAVHNRADGASLPVGDTPVQVVAPAADVPLVGADVIQRWMATWQGT